MKKLFVLLMSFSMLVLLTACFNETKAEKNEKSESMKRMLEEFVNLEKTSKRIDGDVLNGIYLKGEEETSYYSMNKLEAIAGNENSILEFIGKVNLSDLTKSYVVYNLKAIAFGIYEGASDFKLESKFTNANDTIGKWKIVYNMEYKENRYANGNIIEKVITEVNFENKKEIYGMGYEYDVKVLVSSPRINLIKIEGGSNDLNVENGIGEGKVLLTEKVVMLGYVLIYAVSGEEIVESKKVKIENDVIPPSVPGNLTIVTVSNTEIAIKWDKSYDNEVVKGYKVYRNGEYLSTVEINEYKDLGLQHSTQYIYTLKSFDETGNESGLSQELKVTTTTPENVLKRDDIYTDFIAPIWLTDSWSSPAINTEASFQSESGKVIEITHGASGWDAFLLAKRLPGWNLQYMYTNQYKNLCFSFNPGNNLNNIDRLLLAIKDGGTFLNVIDLIPDWEIMSDAEKINKWHFVSVPLSKFIAPNERFFNLIFFDASNGSIHYYLDNIYLEWQEDKTAPAITDIEITVSLDYSEAELKWKTDEYTKYAVEYGINDYSEEKITSQSGYANMSHEVKFLNLKTGNTYKYKITATDIQTISPALNKTVYEGTIKVDAAPDTNPSLVETKTEENSLTYVKLKSTTDRATTIEIYYGITDFTNIEKSTALQTSHSVVIKNLSPGTEYNYYIVLTDAFGNKTTTGNYKFITSNDYNILKLHFEIDSVNGKKPISPYIYGSNNLSGSNKTLMKNHNLGFGRMGGNSFTTYNWENNANNAGEDWYNLNYDYIPWIYCDNASEYDIPGSPVKSFLENVISAGANTAALVTIPIQGYVAADKDDSADVNTTPNYLNTRFKISKARKDSGSLSLNPDINDNYVYQDEFINWINNKFPNQTIFYSLDNEPDLWMYTHPRIHPLPVTYEELISKSIEYGTMIKDMAPNSMVFGPASYGWYGYVALQGAPDAAGRDFLDFYMQKMKEAETAQNRRIVDVLDLHWYPEDNVNGVRVSSESNNTEAVAKARMQTTRSLWDENFVENSWIASNIGGAVNLIPRMKNKIDANYPGTKLAFTEYYFGGGNHISGAIAQADALGIFGKYDVFAASLWHMGDDNSFIIGAFDMFRNYDNNGSKFGDIYLPANTNDFINTSIYAGTDNVTGKLTAVLINKENTWSDGDIKINGGEYNFATVYVLEDNSPVPKITGNMTPVLSNKFLYSLPPYSISTIVFEKK